MLVNVFSDLKLHECEFCIRGLYNANSRGNVPIYPWYGRKVTNENIKASN